MSLKGRMAKGLEEVAHFFFSDIPPPERLAAQSSGRVWALLSLVKGLPTSILTTNLAVELARLRMPPRPLPFILRLACRGPLRLLSGFCVVKRTKR